MLAAALRPQDGAQTRPVHDIIALEVAREANVAVWHVHLWFAEHVSFCGAHFNLQLAQNAVGRPRQVGDLLYSLPRAAFWAAFLVSRFTLVA